MKQPPRFLRRWARTASRLLWRDNSLVPTVRLGLCLVLLGCVLTSCMARKAAAPAPGPAVVIRAEPKREDAFTAGEPDGGAQVLPPLMPESPLPWQKTPPCDPDAGEVAVQGACYLPINVWPCPRKLVERKGKCFRTVPKDPKLPISGEP